MSHLFIFRLLLDDVKVNKSHQNQSTPSWIGSFRIDHNSLTKNKSNIDRKSKNNYIKYEKMQRLKLKSDQSNSTNRHWQRDDNNLSRVSNKNRNTTRLSSIKKSNFILLNENGTIYAVPPSSPPRIDRYFRLVCM